MWDREVLALHVVGPNSITSTAWPSEDPHVWWSERKENLET